MILALPTISLDVDLELRTHEIRWASTGERELDWTAGYYLREASRRGTTVISLPGFTSTSLLTQSNDAYAVFGELTWRIPSTRWSITAGLRYFSDDVTATNVTSAESVTLDTTFGSWNPRLSVTFKPDNDTTLYASVARGFRSGLPQSISALIFARDNLGIELPESTDADHIWTYEVGAKRLMMDSRLQIESAIFYSDWSDIPVERPFVADVVVGYGNTEGATPWGVELNVSYVPLKGLTLQANGSYVRAPFKESIPGTLVVAGTQVFRVPEIALGGSVGYSWPVGGELSGVVYGSVQYSSATEAAPAAAQIPIDRNTTVTARIGVESTAGWGIYAYGDNLTDEYRNIDGADRITGYGARPRPRTIGIEFRYTH